ncbi:transposase [Clostridia bacterium]|nr:transposase [Clostridia bacterium]
MSDTKKKQPVYTDEFKTQLVQIVKSGRKATEVAREYGLSHSSLLNWCKMSEQSGSFRLADNRSEAEKERIELRKKNRQLEMELDVLKKAMVIMSKQ